VRTQSLGRERPSLGGLDGSCRRCRRTPDKSRVHLHPVIVQWAGLALSGVEGMSLKLTVAMLLAVDMGMASFGFDNRISER
jgi:hypothetical protein